MESLINIPSRNKIKLKDLNLSRSKKSIKNKTKLFFINSNNFLLLQNGTEQNKING